MDQFPNDSESNIFSLTPREVYMHDHERDRLAEDSGNLIDETFIYRDYSETIETFEPLALYAQPDKAPNAAFKALMPRVYDLAHVETAIDHQDSESYLCYAKITLLKRGIPLTVRSELILRTDDATDEPIDISNPMFYLKTPSLRADEQDDVIPLDLALTKDLLHGLLQQSDSAQFQDKPGALLDMVHALVSQSSDAQAERKSTCRISHQDAYGDVTVTIQDRNRLSKGIIPEHLAHSAKVQIFQPFSADSGAMTTLQFTALESTSYAELSMQYADETGESDYEQAMLSASKEYNDQDLQNPGKFSTQLMKALYLMRSPPVDSTLEEWA